MPHHVIIDGSNLATEGRTAPSLKQLNEAIEAYRDDHPHSLITVVVDATFGHRIDAKEVPEFERAIETNAFVAPPAGAVGRGDGFILSIANKVNATVLSNDSFQEFHGEYAWLFDEGRLAGGKPVPHVGWVFVNRTPVRGPVSRRSVKEQKVVDKSPGRRRSSKPSVATPSISANAPMPIPTSAPPGAVMPPAKHVASRAANDLLVFLSFVEHHPVGTTVEAVVDSYSSHGAYVLIGDTHGYVPLRLMGDPPPRSAREAMALGDRVTLVVSSFAPARRSIDLAVLSMSPDARPAEPARQRTPRTRKPAQTEPVAPVPSPITKQAPVPKKAPVTKRAPVRTPPPKRAPAKSVPAKKAPPEAPSTKTPAIKQIAGKRAPAKPAPIKSASATASPTARVASKKETVAKSAARTAHAKPSKTVAAKSAKAPKSARS